MKFETFKFTYTAQDHKYHPMDVRGTETREWTMTGTWEYAMEERETLDKDDHPGFTYKVIKIEIVPS